jgi:hypothetical protein
MLITKKVECPTCGRKVKKSDLILVETTIKTKVTCCPDCIKYLNVRKTIKDDKSLLSRKESDYKLDESVHDGTESIYKSHLKAKNIDILKQSKEEQDTLPDAQEMERRALEEQKRIDRIAERNKQEEIENKKITEETKEDKSLIERISSKDNKKEETKSEETEEKPDTEKQGSSLLETIGVTKKETDKEEKYKKSEPEKNDSKKDDYFGSNNKKEKTPLEKLKETASERDEKIKKENEDQIIGSHDNADRISQTIQKKQKEREFKVTASDWMVTSDPMIDKISLAIERKQKERAEKGYIKINGKKVVKQKKQEGSEPTVIPIEEEVKEKKEEKTIEEKVDEKIGEPEEKKPYEAPGTQVKKILKVRCPTCNKEFSIEKRSGKVHLKCPNCGEEGEVEL